jgi:ParB-like chromosome segregation protein Spo0J
MTSGRFTTLPVESIVIDRAVRQRRALTKIDDLAASIAARGLINPIVVTPEGVLVAGERRLTAVRALGWTHIHVHYTSDIPLDELRLIELEENTKREEVDWKDQVAALAEIHALRSAGDPNWDISDTAESIGMPLESLRVRLKVNKAIEEGDPLISNADSYSAAQNLVARKAQRAAANLTDSILQPDVSAIPLHHADIREWLTAYEGPPFNFLHCDFPYGINFDKQRGQNSANKERYDDSFATYEDLIQNVLPSIPIAEQCHLMFWFSPVHWEYTKLALVRGGWVVNPFPLVWVKSDNSGLLPDPQRGGRRTYEVAFAASKGDRLVAQPVAMHWHGARGPAEHASLKPRAMLAHFFRMFVDESTIMLDPTCGSGNAVRVAKDMGASYVAGVEAIEDYWRDALRGWESV